MKSVVAAGRMLLATVGSVALGAGLAVTLAPTATALPAAASLDRSAPVSAPAGPRTQALSNALPARLGSANYTSVYGATRAKSSSGKKLMVSLSASKQAGGKPSFYLSLSRGQAEQHAWRFPAANSSFHISGKAAGKLSLSPKKTGGMGKINLKVKPHGAMKSQKCGGKVYSQTRNVTVSGTVFFDTGSAWGKVGSKTKSLKFRTTHQVYFSYDVTCPPVDYPDACYASLSWSSSHSTAKTYSYLSATKQGSSTSIYAYRTTQLSKPAGASRIDAAWGAGGAPVLTVAPDGSAKLKIHGVKGSGTLTDPNPGSTSDDPCDTGTQQLTNWWSGTVTNDAKRIKVPAQVFGAFTVANGTAGALTKASFD